MARLSCAAAAMVACAVVLLVAPAQGYPSFWVALNPNCTTNHPTKGQGAHKVPVADRTIAFTFKDAKGAPVTALCAGASYTVMVTTPQPRRLFLTASSGALTGLQNMAGFATCTKRVYSSEFGYAPVHTARYTAPASGTAVQFRATSATAPSSHFMQANTTVALRAAGACNLGPAKPAAVKPVTTSAAAPVVAKAPVAKAPVAKQD